MGGPRGARTSPSQSPGYADVHVRISRGAITARDLASLQVFSSPVARIERLDGFGHAANLRHLNLRYNRIEDASSLSGMTELAALDLEGNAIADIAALVENAGLGEGDKVVLAGNPLRRTALDAQLPLLEARGVFVGFLDDHGDRAGTATTLAPGGNVAGTLSTLDDEDVFRLEIPAATDVVLYTTGSTNARGYLSGVGPRRLATNNDGGRSGNFLIRRRLKPGVYHVTVSGLDGLTSPRRGRVLRYAWLRKPAKEASMDRLSLAVGAALLAAAFAYAEDDHGAQPESATLLGVGDTVSGELGADGGVDVLRIDVHGTADFEVRTTGPSDTTGKRRGRTALVRVDLRPPRTRR